MATLAEQLAAARKAAGMTQEELSAAVHVARNTISNWEHGRTEPNLDTLRKLGQVLHADFLNGEAAPTEDRNPETATDADAGKDESAPARRPQKKKIIVLCAAALVVVVVAVVLLV